MKLKKIMDTYNKLENCNQLLNTLVTTVRPTDLYFWIKQFENIGISTKQQLNNIIDFVRDHHEKLEKELEQLTK